MPKVADPLCPLGFHPQVRWPTRCKRCFREYKEHSNSTNRKESAESSSSSIRREDRSGSVDSLDDSKFDNIPTPVVPVRSRESVALSRRNTTEIPLLRDEAQGDARSSKNEKESEKSKDYGSIYSSIAGSAFSRLTKHRSSAALQDPSGASAIAKSSGEFEPSRRGSSGDESEKLRKKRVQIHSLKEVPSDSNYNSPDVQFILEVKRSNIKSRGSDDDANSFAGTDITETTETTETTLVETNFDELQDQVNSMKKEIDKYRARCERLEREKDELSNKKFRSIGMNGGTGSESMRLQQRIRELETTNEDLMDDKRSAELRVTELERELESRPSSAQTHKAMEEIRAKSAAAEALIEELMEENEELKKDMRQMVDEMDELQDNFREDQADEYRDLKKDLEQTAKNCRILQFKLRKAERRMEQLETDKHQLESQNQELRNGSNPSVTSSIPSKGQDQISQLEQELNQTREQLAQSQREVQKLQSQIRAGGKDAPLSGPVLSKSRSLEGANGALSKSTEDVSQLQRDLQDSHEREADLREQLKFAEEEAQSLRKKLSRVEEENESLVMQLKKMAMKKGSRRNTPDSSVDKDEGISGDVDDLSLSELRLQLELNEQETAVLRRKMEDIEGENDRLSKEVLELQEQVKSKPTTSAEKAADARSHATKPTSEELNKLKTELMEKDKEIEHLNEALTQAEKNKGKVVVQRSRSLESSESALDLKRQLQLVEQEAGILRSKTVDLEAENEKMTAENRRLHLRVSRKAPPTDAEKLLLDKLELEERIQAMEKKLTEATNHKQHIELEKSPRLGRASDRGTRLSTSSINPESSVLKREKEILERDLKSKEEQINSLTLRLQHMEKENENLHHRMETRMAAVKRTPKKPSDTMTKIQLKKMVEELEIEFTDLLAKTGAGQPLPSDTKKIAELTKNLKEEREQRENLQHDKKKLDEKITKLEADVRKANSNSSANQILQEKCDKLEKEKAEMTAKMQSGDFVDLDTLHQVKQEKHKLQKELTERDNRLSELEKKVKESEDKNRKMERTLKDNNERIADVEREMEEERAKARQTEAAHKELSLNWLKERDELKKQASDLRIKMDELESSIVVKDKKIKDLDASLKDEVKKAVDAALKKSEREIKLAKEETVNFKTKAEDLEQKLTRAEMDKKGLNERIQRLEADWRKERDQLIGRATDLEVEIKAERKKKDRVEKEYEGEMREKDDEVMGLRERVKRTEIELKAALERFEELKNQDTRSRELELELEKEHQEYEDLTAKYDLLEEDYLVIKAKLVMDKQNIEREYLSLKKEHDTVEGELRTLRETFNLRQDTWIKEKLDMQEKVKELEEKELRHSGENWYIERSRLKDIIEEKNQQLEKVKRDEEMHRNHIDNIRRENDELRRKLEDFDKVTKIQRSMTYDSSEHDREMRELRNRLAQEEKAHRSEMTHAKMRSDNKIALLQEETQATQMQLEKARRERDTFREMLDGAQRMISELKSDPSKKTKSGSEAARSREMEETLTRIEEFHAQITSLEDELNEARTETSRIKTEYINEKSAKEIKISELQTKINELEEDRIMAMGRSRITGTRTRLELAWQKEREEQQRLIQESSTLARDLRQTLLEVEKERDRERLESRRRLEQQKRANEEEQVEIRKKVTELQSDLLELRDAHAKLRTSCEKLRRDKERVEKERDDTKKSIVDSRKADADTERRVGQLIAEIQKMKDLCPLAMGESLSGELPTGVKRDKDVRQEKIREEFVTTLKLINKCSEDVKRLQQRESDDSSKRTTMFRRAMSNAPGDMGTTSTSNNNGESITPAPSITKRAPVYRRALSLEQSQNFKDIETTSSSSYASNSYMDDEPPYASYRSRTVDRDLSLDRQSTDSTRSESAVIATPETKKKRSLMGKIKQLTKSRSIEDTGTANLLVNAGIQALIPSVSVAPSGSDLSLDKDPDRKKEKKTVKDKLTGMFKKGSSSRTSSMERSDSTESRDRYTPSKDSLSVSVSDRPLQRPPSLTNLSAPGSSRGTTPISSSRATPSRSGMLRSQSSVETDV
ncbi:myosin-11 isoform X1 [Daphnia magna]|uniref:myosin-11 isoform X1 n=1 Tax=Daphnia magna TaxID=35525 RepID=UPI001E1BDD08|nr:myosin-11 isoform X1 [Daphnia magna]